MLALKVKLKDWTLCLGKLPKPHRPQAAGRLSVVASGAWRGRRQDVVYESALTLPIRGLLSDVT